MQLMVLQEVQGGIGVWLDLSTGQTRKMPIRETSNLGITAVSNDKPLTTSDNLCCLPNFEPDEGEEENG